MQRDSFVVEKFPSLERFQSDFRGRTIDVCIATEEIIGPVRNGGIASTYYHLARGLARQGHRVTVLYLKGRRVENETPEHWIDHYKEFGIDLVYLDDLEEAVLAPAERWQKRYYAFYKWLQKNDRFDVVHTSEWRGGAFYCLQAKKLGLAFYDTFFIVKTSSPHIWNRHYQMQPIDEPDLLTAAFAEQKCVEWADMVVGGSAHLLSFMRHIGYAIPDGRTYAQPNIIDFSEVIVTDLRDKRPFGDVMKTKELVFFGRLEPRKGLELFIDAMNALVSRGIMPERLTLLGKEGERLRNRGNMKPLDFIAANARHWPFPVEVVTDKNQPEALSYMCQRDMIAVMPSLIENSTMAVYEALVHKIPFIATGVGGTPELVSEQYHAACLIEPSAELLALGIERALTHGQPIATPAFDNGHNLETWYAFHRFVAEHGTRAIVEAQTPHELPTARPQGDRISYLAYPSDFETARAIARALAAQKVQAFDEAFLCIPFLLSTEERAEIDGILPPGARLVDSIGVSIGDAFNRAAAQTFGEILVFDASDGIEFRPAFGPKIRTALTTQPDAIVSSFVAFPEDPSHPDGGKSILFMPMGGDIASQYATNSGYGVELIALRAGTQHKVGPFEPYNLSNGILHEFVTRAIASGTEYYVVPEPLLDHVGREHPLGMLSSNYQYLKSKHMIDAVPLYLKKVLLYFLGKRPGGQTTARAASLIWNGNREEGETAWITNVRKIGNPAIDDLKRGPLLIGFDNRRSRLKVALWGVGHFRVSLNTDIEIDEPEYGRPGALSIRFYDVLPAFERGDRAWIKIEFNDDKQKRQRVIALQRMEEHLYYLGSKRAVYWDGDFQTAAQMLATPPATKAKPPSPISIAAE